MNSRCRQIQEILAEQGPQAFAEDIEAQDHLASCGECFAVLEALEDLDLAFAELPVQDAPDAIVERLLRSPELSSHRENPVAPKRSFSPADWLEAAGRHLALRLPRRSRLHRLHMAAIGALAVLAVVIILPTQRSPQLEVGEFRMDDTILAKNSPIPGRPAGERQKADAEAEEIQPKRLEALGYLREESGDLDSSTEERASGRTFRGGSPRVEPASEGRAMSDPAEQEEAKEKLAKLRTRQEHVIAVTSESPLLDARKVTTGDEVTQSELEEIPTSRDPWSIFEPVPGVIVDRINVGGSKSRQPSKKNVSDSPGDDDVWSVDGVVFTNRAAIGSSPSYHDDSSFEEMEVDLSAELLEQAAVRDFLTERSRVEGLSFQPARGYWSTTYLPGDPTIRLLDARLQAAGREHLLNDPKSTWPLHERFRPAVQPFDPPKAGSIGLYLSADRRAVDGPSRALLQVGLQGTERRGGRRGAMNVAMVLDLSEEVPRDVGTAMRALAAAFGRAHDLGDAFSLHVAGPQSGIEITSEGFRHGALSLALNQLFGEGGEGPGEARSLAETIERASEALLESDDPEAQLGTSLVLLVTGRELGDELQELSSIAHRSAVAGRPLSVVGLGGAVDPEELDALVRDGQGRRRLLSDPSAASELLERELSSASQAVARALRLSIRLATGVQLIEVLGSQRLGEARAERIREAERSVDLRVARDLGIVMDRGEDEEGIQIVIPAFQAGDAHVVLLDVVVSGPGPLAEVTARYKDLVELRNGTSRATLELARGDAAPGAIEHNVILNLMARRLADTLRSAGDELRSGNDELAACQLADLRALLQGLVEESHDYAVLTADLLLIDEFTALISDESTEEEWESIADSLQVAGHRKMHGKEKK